MYILLLQVRVVGEVQSDYNYGEELEHDISVTVCVLTCMVHTTSAAGLAQSVPCTS